MCFFHLEYALSHVIITFQFVKHLTVPQLAEMQTLFNHYDHDKDGRIDHASVRSIVTEINPQINKDGILERC